MPRALPVIVQSQIEKTLGETSRSIRDLNERVALSVINSSTSLSRLNEHTETSFDAHKIKELLLDAVNENLLLNSGLELDEDFDGVPDDWEFVNEIGEPDARCLMDDSRSKYGYHSVKLEGINRDVAYPKRLYVRQRITGPWYERGLYCLSFYYIANKNSLDYSIFADVDVFDANESLISHIPLGPIGPMLLQHDIGEYPSNMFYRFYQSFRLPEGARELVVSIGVTINPNTTLPVEVWLDYFCLNPGAAPLRPGELVEGILKTKHISTEGLDAKVIKTGTIKITKDLSLETEGGDVKLYYNTENKGNVLEFFDKNKNPLISLGKYGVQEDDYGLLIKNAQGEDALKLVPEGIHLSAGKITLGDKFSVDSEGNLRASSADISGILRAGAGSTIGGFRLENDQLRSIDDSLIIDTTTSQLKFSPEENYATTFQSDGIFATLPLWRVSGDNFDNTQLAENYYIASMQVSRGDTVYEEGRDYEWSKAGEVVRKRNSRIPQNVSDITFTYRVIDGRGAMLREYTFIETNQAFTVTTRSNAIITDDNALDASFIKNLVLGTADIGWASITDAHIRNISANKITVGDEPPKFVVGIDHNTEHLFHLDGSLMSNKGIMVEFRV